MKPAVPILIGVAVIGFVGYGLFAPQPSDEEQIKSALAESLKAGKEGRPGSVLELLSDNFKVNNAQSPGTGAIAKAIRDYRPTIEIANQTPSVVSDQATIKSPATVSVSIPPMSLSIREMTLGFRKEEGRRLLIFPAKSWKLESVTVPDSVVNEISSGFSGAE